MRRDFSLSILDLDGKEIEEGGKKVTLCTVALSALLTTVPGESITGQDKADRMQLAMKINKRPREVDLTAEQMAMIKRLIGATFGPLAVGRAYELLEAEPKLAAVQPDVPSAG